MRLERRVKRWPMKDMKRRKFYKIYEINKLVLKSLLSNDSYSLNFKYYYTNLFNKFPIESSLSGYVNSCMWRLHSARSISKFFKLSRHALKYCGSNGLLMGFRKSSVK